MIKIKKKIMCLIIVMLFSICITNQLYASEKLELDKEKLTEDYKKWESLPENDKKNYIQPLPFSTDLTVEDIGEGDKNAKLKSSSLPTSYSLKDDIELKVRNQQSTEECWAFTTTNLISTNLQKRGLANSFTLFSTRHMNYSTSLTFLDGKNSKGYNREVSVGGNCYLGLNYCTAGYGPVLETQMPFENNNDKIYLSKIEGKTVSSKINEYIQLPSLYKKTIDDKVVCYNGYSESSTYYKEYSDQEVQTVRNKIKEQIKNNGAVSAYTYLNGTQYFNTNSLLTSKSYYCYDESTIPNHAVTIVGWDDNYSASNFNSSNRPKNNGAYIVLNSHGEGYYDKGYMYVSYDDVLIEKNPIGIVETSKIDYNNIYQYDELGYSASISQTGTTSAYIANVYNKKSNSSTKKEYLNEVSFYVPTESTVDIYANVSNDNKTNIQLVKSCGQLGEGYHTAKLTTPLEITGSKFVIGAKYTNNSGYVTLPMEFNYSSNGMSSNFWDTAKSESGQSYYSTNKTSWTDLANDYSNSNFCIKAFTTEKEISTVKATGVSLNKTSMALQVGDAQTLVATVAPTNATNKSVTWSSSNTQVATVSNTGVVKAIKAGTSVITVKTSDGGYTAKCNVTVANSSIISQTNQVGVTYVSHVQDYGWQNWVSDGAISGTSGKGKRVEALYIKLVNAPTNGQIMYQTHVQDIGWQDWKSNGALTGTSGKAKRIEAIKIKLGNMSNYTVQYRVHIQDIGWQDWKSDGELAGTTGKGKRIEAIQIRILKKSSDIGVTYVSHVQSYGWQNWVSNGALTGTSGKAKRIESIKIKLENLPNYTIQYRVHVQDVGWQGWKSDGELAGTTGKGKRIEAIQIRILEKRK